MKVSNVSSILCGVICAIITFVISLILIPERALMLAVLSGALFTLLLHVALTIEEKHDNKILVAIEQEMNISLFYKTRSAMKHGKKVKTGNLYLVEEGFLFISPDQKPYTCDKISKHDIDRYEFDKTQMTIYTKDGDVFWFLLTTTQDVIKELQAKNWIQ